MDDLRETLVRLLADAQLREAQLEGAYTAGQATPQQLAELEDIRSRMEGYMSTLEDMGHYITS